MYSLILLLKIAPYDNFPLNILYFSGIGYSFSHQLAKLVVRCIRHSWADIWEKTEYF